MCKVSIIVPVYKTKKEYLTECLDSIINQTLPEIQIILVDDGSPDECGMICDTYASRDPRITVIHQENQGVSCARNTGIEVANGTCVLFVDADDLLALDACEKLYQQMMVSQSEILLYGHKCFNENNEVKHCLGRDVKFTAKGIKDLQKVILNPAGELLEIAPAGTWGKMYKRSFIQEHHLRYIQGLERMQDNLFCIYAYQVAKAVSYYDYIGYHYRIHGESVCNKYNPGIFQILEKTLDEFWKFVETYAEDLKPYYYCKVITVLENEYLHLYFRNKNNPKNKKQLKAEFVQVLRQKKYWDAVKKADISILSKRLKLITFLLKYHQVGLVWLLLDTEEAIRRLLKKADKI